MEQYIDELWEGINESLDHFDADGSTAWSEAPAEGIFSVMQDICDHKQSIKLTNLTKLCRVNKEGPQPGSKRAAELTQKSVDMWPSVHAPGSPQSIS